MAAHMQQDSGILRVELSSCMMMGGASCSSTQAYVCQCNDVGASQNSAVTFEIAFPY